MSLRLNSMADYEALKNRDTGKGSGPVFGKVIRPPKREKGMNKAEAFYSYELERMKQAGEIRSWKFEGVKLFLAERTTYTPDFLVWMKNGDIALYEVKAVWKSKGKPHWEDDARAKTKIAAELFPEFLFWAVWWEDNHFEYEYFGSRRIGYETIGERNRLAGEDI